MDVHELFKNKFDALRDKVDPVDVDPYSMLEASAIVRHLLMDGLLQQFNRQARAQIVFEVLPALQMDRPSAGVLFESTVGYMSPHLAMTPDQTTEKLTLGQFLSRPITTLLDQTYSVRDIIDVAANSLGGVHHGPPRGKDKRLEPLYSMGSESTISVGMPDGAIIPVPSAAISNMQDIGLVTVIACVRVWNANINLERRPTSQ